MQRFARSHGPFTQRDVADRYGLGTALAESLLLRLTAAGRLIRR
jgi:ATP-dependent Lhr-like helicase